MRHNLYPVYPILLVDDEENFLNSVYINLKSNGINNVERCRDSLEVIPILEKKKYSLILLDILMPGKRGDELLPKIIEKYPDIPIILLTAVNETETAVECMSYGALDYIVKPTETEHLIKSVRNALNIIEVRKENNLSKKNLFPWPLKRPKHFEGIITQNKKMFDIFKYIETIALSESPVLITGETGTGKELIARAIHKASKRKGDFITENIAVLDEQVFSDTLFGHIKGAFTSIERDRKGLLDLAANGTLFLDDIGELLFSLQAKLLRLVQARNYYPLGSEKPKSTKARIIFSTNRDLMTMIEKGNFRKDLYYCLQSHHIHIPPLRERKEDIPLLVEHFIKKAAKELRKEIPPVPEELINLLSNYNFSGNIRELKSMVFEAVRKHQYGDISLDVFLDRIQNKACQIDSFSYSISVDKAISKDKKVTFGESLPTFAELEAIYMKEVLERENWNQAAAARLAGLPRSTFSSRWKRLKEKFKNEKIFNEVKK